MPKTAKVAAHDPDQPQAHMGYRPDAVGRLTGIPTRSIYHAIARGDIRHVRVGRAIVIPGSEVLRLTGQAAG